MIRSLRESKSFPALLVGQKGAIYPNCLISGDFMAGQCICQIHQRCYWPYRRLLPDSPIARIIYLLGGLMCGKVNTLKKCNFSAAWRQLDLGQPW